MTELDTEQNNKLYDYFMTWERNMLVDYLIEMLPYEAQTEILDNLAEEEKELIKYDEMDTNHGD